MQKRKTVDTLRKDFILIKLEVIYASICDRKIKQTIIV